MQHIFIKNENGEIKMSLFIVVIKSRYIKLMAMI